MSRSWRKFEVIHFNFNDIDIKIITKATGKTPLSEIGHTKIPENWKHRNQHFRLRWKEFFLWRPRNIGRISLFHWNYGVTERNKERLLVLCITKTVCDAGFSKVLTVISWNCQRNLGEDSHKNGMESKDRWWLSKGSNCRWLSPHL